MIHLDSSRSLPAAGLLVRFGLVVALASGLAGCNTLQKLAKDDNGGQSPSGTSMTAQEWLNAWAAMNGGSKASPADETSSAEQPVSAKREETFASGVMGATEADPRPTSNHRNGSRLHVRTVLTEQGQQSWIGWHDTERAEDCTFQRDAEGTLRCLPSRATREVYFADASCATRVAAISEQQRASVDYALQSEGNQCAVGVRVYPLRGAIETPSNVFVQDHAGRCAPAELPAAVRFRALGDELPFTAFVAARQGIEGNDARVKAVGLVADDGAVSVTGFMDSELNTPCSWQGTHRTTCVPWATAVSTFADEVCSQPLLRADRNKCAPEVTFGVAREADGCGMSYYQPGESYQGSTIYEVSEASYQSQEISLEEASSLQLGVRVEQEELATGEVDRMPSNTRLSARHWTTDGGVWFAGWYDNTLKTSCNFVQTNEDVWQCLPSDAATQVLYADAACTQPITEVQGSDDCGDANESPRFITQAVAEASGGPAPQVRRVFAERPHLATVYEQTDLGCEGRMVSEGHRYFDLSQPLPANSFARGFVIVQ
ncbi:MAG TPA: hypothetical protein VHO25_08445 [Polyangiaceae bacterium]|nr:hypothetical protein [Polyangiaceae bacterium]